MDVALLSPWRYTERNNADNLLFKGSQPSSVDQGKDNFIDRWTVNGLGSLGDSAIKRLEKQGRSEIVSSIHESRMPVTTGSQSLLASLPSFMSVFGDGLGPRNASEEVTTASQFSNRPQSSTNRRPSHHTLPSSYAYRRSSSTTLRSDSTESSPTTTISTVDSTLTEPSPSSSPESPTLSLPLSSLSSLKASSPRSEDGAMDHGTFPTSPPSHVTSFGRADSPNKKMRNTKNLSLNTTGSSKQAYGAPGPRLAAINTINGVHPHAFSAPASPSFIVPPKAPKRKPSSLGLTITTPENGIMGQLSRSHSDIVPQTPSLSTMTTIQHVEGPANIPLFSPTVAPEGGMQLPPFGPPSVSHRSSKIRPTLSLSQNASFDSSHSSPIVLQTLEHVPEENDCDLPLSREVKSPAYPEGPVCIYQPGVYLYLEPNDTEASEFDVIINVAREVRNPFEIAAEKVVQPKVKDAAVQVNLIPGETNLANPCNVGPPSAVSEKSFCSAFEVQPNVNNEPTISDTPKATKSSPEYLHVPWDHNTNVVDDLLRLCELIDHRVSQGKRILVHCQCGVSRSASLIVAYGLYKNSELTVQEAYDAVKERSRWIGPNMHLIYQLAEFKSMLPRKSQAILNQQNRRSLGMMRSQTDNHFMHPKVNSMSTMSSVIAEPSTAPLHNDQESISELSDSLSPPGSSQHVNSMWSGQITPGPSTAPSDVQRAPSILGAQPGSHSWEEETTMTSPLAPPTSPPRLMDIDNNQTNSPTSLDLGSQEQKLDAPPQLDVPIPISSPLLPGGFSSMALRRNAPRNLPFHTESHSLVTNKGHFQHTTFDHIMADALPATPSLLSPRAAEFTASPFHRTVAGDLAGSSVFEQSLLNSGNLEKDPRSPPTKGEAPITRSIDEVL